MKFVNDVSTNWTDMSGETPVVQSLNSMLTFYIIGNSAPSDECLDYAEALSFLWDSGRTGMEFYLGAMDFFDHVIGDLDLGEVTHSLLAYKALDVLSRMGDA